MILISCNKRESGLRLTVCEDGWEGSQWAGEGFLLPPANPVNPAVHHARCWMNMSDYWRISNPSPSLWLRRLGWDSWGRRLFSHICQIGTSSKRKDTDDRDLFLPGNFFLILDSASWSGLPSVLKSIGNKHVETSNFSSATIKFGVGTPLSWQW
jgi:hypothetical protein